MPMIFEPSDLSRTGSDEATVVRLANPEMLGTNALQVERILLQPGARSSSYQPRDVERFVYVIRGKGKAQVGDQSLTLEPESVLWLETGDAFSLQAEQEELEVLLCHAPARD